MNIERLKILRDHIANLPPERCDMGAFARGSDDTEQPAAVLHLCGTAGCLAGYAVAMFGTKEQQSNFDYRHIEKSWPDDIAMGLLGLSDDERSALFMMEAANYGLLDADQASMVQVLNILMDEGIVDWDRAIDETRP